MKCKHKLPKSESYCEVCRVYQQRIKELFHVFTNDFDDWVNTKTEALKIARELYKDHGTARVYHETTWNEINGIFEDGDCIYSRGYYPF